MKTITVEKRVYTVRWRPDFTQDLQEGHYTGTINEYRLPHLHKSVKALLKCARMCAKSGDQWMENNLGKPMDIEAFLKSPGNEGEMRN